MVTPTLRSVISRFLFALSALGALSPIASAKTIHLRLATMAIPGSFYAATIAKVPERIAKATNGQVKIEIFDSLIPGDQLAAAVREGRVDMVGATHPYLSAEEPRLTVGNLPGLIETADEYRRALDGGWQATMDKIWLTKYNAVRLLDGIYATQGLWSRKPIQKIEDFKGLRIRVHNVETADLMTQLGAKPTAVSAAEMLPSLERGVLDGIFTSVDVAYGLNFAAVATHGSSWGFSNIAGFAVLMNANAWKKLDPKLQAAIRKEMSAIEHEQFANHAAESAKLIAALRASKLDYYEVPKAERAKLLDPKYVKPVYDAWFARTKKLGIDATPVIENIEKTLGKKLPY